MTEPALAAERFGIGCLLGLGLGLWYSILRPLRRRRNGPADALFLLGAFCAWLYHGFRVCGGDLRLGYSGGLLLGAAVFDRMLGVPLEPVFAQFWSVIRKILGIVLLPGRIFFRFSKKQLHLGENGLK